jgi:hypothetical protein
VGCDDIENSSDDVLSVEVAIEQLHEIRQRSSHDVSVKFAAPAEGFFGLLTHDIVSETGRNVVEQFLYEHLLASNAHQASEKLHEGAFDHFRTCLAFMNLAKSIGK